jgi:hypothetical protein
VKGCNSKCVVRSDHLRILSTKCFRGHARTGLRERHRHTWPESAGRDQRRFMARAIRIELQWDQQIRSDIEDGGIDARVQNSNDRGDRTVDAQLSANDARIRAESPLPEAVAQNDNTVAARLIFRRQEGASESRPGIKDVEEVGIGLERERLLSMAADTQVHVARAKRCNVLPGGRLISPDVQFRF